MSILSKGAAALIARQTAAIGQTLEYTRAGQSWPIVGWVGNAAFSRQQADPGAQQLAGERDYLIPVANLAAAGMTAPQKGDQIAETINGITETFEMQPNGAEPCWRYSDQTRMLFRCHTKRVS